MVESIHVISSVVQELHEWLIIIQTFKKFPVVVELTYTFIIICTEMDCLILFESGHSYMR
jgi:hypothetical protein